MDKICAVQCKANQNEKFYADKFIRHSVNIIIFKLTLDNRRMLETPEIIILCLKYNSDQVYCFTVGK